MVLLLYHVQTTYIESSGDLKSVDVCVCGFCLFLSMSHSMMQTSILHKLFEFLKLSSEVQPDPVLNLSFSEVLNSHTLHSSQERSGQASFTFIMVLLANIQQFHSRVSVLLLISDITSFSTWKHRL